MMKTKILGVGITNATSEEILEYIVEKIEKQGKKGYVVTPNPEILVFAAKNPDFQKTLNNAEIAINDGVGVGWAAQLLQKPLKSRVTGVDLMESLCKVVSKRPITVGFLGAQGRIAELTAECLRQKYPGLKMAFVGPEWGQEGFDLASKLQTDYSLQTTAKKGSSVDRRQSTVDVLFVAFGFPKQEFWMEQYIDKLDVRVMMGVGGAFDYISGAVPRAPQFLRAMGLEWLFRLVVQPWRLKRQLALIEFVWLVFKEKFFPPF